MPKSVLKDPNAVLDYVFDWAALTNGTGGADWLADGETITEITITPTPTDGITVDSSAITDSATSATVWLSGGTSNVIYTVTCHITTSSGRQDDRSLTVTVVNR